MDYVSRIDESKTGNITELFQEVNEGIKPIKPSHLFDEGVTTPFVNMGAIEDIFTENTNTVGHNTLVIVFPGILSEFIEVGAFEDVFKNTVPSPDSTLEEEFKSNLSKYSGSRDVVDRVFNTEKLTYVEMPLSSLVEVVSVKVRHLYRAFDVLRFSAITGSLETLGTEEESMEPYMRRLDKYFRIMGRIPNRIHFVGYSRGALVALETLVR